MTNVLGGWQVPGEPTRTPREREWMWWRAVMRRRRTNQYGLSRSAEARTISAASATAKARLAHYL